MNFRIFAMAATAGAMVWAGAAQMQPAQAQSAHPAQVTKSGNVCLRTTDIRNTTTPDARTILFYMNNGKVWKNTLRSDCPGLRFNGFAYVATPPNQICGNLQTIRAIQTGSVCQLGAFTPYEPKTKADDTAPKQAAPMPPPAEKQQGE